MKKAEILIPKIEMEYTLLNFVAEKLQSGGELENVKDSLYHRETNELYSRIAKGEDCLSDITLPDAFTSAYMGKTQFTQALTHLNDLKGRREHYSEIDKSVFNFDKDYSTKDESVSWGVMLNGSVQRTIDNPRGFIPNDWPFFWDAIRGFMPGEVIGIAGGSGSGKTTFAIDLLTRLQKKYSCKTAFISCEMSQDALGDKIIKRENDLSQLEYNQQVRINPDAILSVDYGNWNDCVFHYKIYDLESIKIFIRKHKPKFFALDYMQMIGKDKNFHNLGEWSTYFMTSIKELCKEVGTVCIALLQLDKSAQKKDAKGKIQIPSLVDILNGTGYKNALDTGLVLYGCNEKRYVYIDKARDTFQSRLMWKHFEVKANPETGKIYNLEPKDDGFRLPD